MLRHAVGYYVVPHGCTLCCACCAMLALLCYACPAVLCYAIVCSALLLIPAFGCGNTRAQLQALSAITAGNKLYAKSMKGLGPLCTLSLSGKALPSLLGADSVSKVGCSFDLMPLKRNAT